MHPLAFEESQRAHLYFPVYLEINQNRNLFASKHQNHENMSQAKDKLCDDGAVKGDRCSFIFHSYICILHLLYQASFLNDRNEMVSVRKVKDLISTESKWAKLERLRLLIHSGCYNQSINQSLTTS